MAFFPRNSKKYGTVKNGRSAGQLAAFQEASKGKSEALKRAKKGGKHGTAMWKLSGKSTPPDGK